MIILQKRFDVMRTTLHFIIFTLGLLLGIPLPATAQSHVTGTLTDSGTELAIAGAHVMLDDTSFGTITDSAGRFDLPISSFPARLTFSAVGYATITRTFESTASEWSIRLRPALIDMDPLVVSAIRELQPRSDVPVSISAISASQIEETAPNMLYQLFNQVAGVHMVDLGNEQYKLSIRQPFTNKAYYLFMEDGVPLRPIGLFNPNALIDVNMAGSARIEVLRGPSSAMYGGNAVAGSVNFITGSPSSVDNATFGLRRDSYGYSRADFSGSTASSKTGFYLGGYVARQRDGWYEHSDFDKVSITGKVDVRIGRRTRLENAVSYSNMDTDTNGALDSLSFMARGFNSKHTFSFRRVQSLRIRSTLRRSWSHSQKSQLTVFFRDSKLDQLPYWKVRGIRGNSSKAKGEVNAQAFWSLGAIAQHEWRFEGLDTKVNAGLSVDRSPSTYRSEWIDVDRDEDGRYISFVSPDSLLSDYDVNIFNAATYARVEVRPVGEMRVSASLRYDRIQYDYDNHLSTEAYSGAPDEATTFDRVSPKIGITYDLGGGRGIYSNYSLGFAPPEVNELYHGVKIPNLKPATFNSIEAGGWAALLNGRLYADISVYSMTGKDEIIPIVSPTAGFVNENAGHTRHQGIEYTFLVVPHRSLSLRFSGSNARHEFVDFVDFGVDRSGNEMAFAPTWTANGEIAFKPVFLDGSRLAVEWSHMGNYFMDNGNTAQYEGYDTFNIRASYRTGPVQIWANLINVFDTLYATNAAAYSWGSIYNVGQVRAVTLGARYRLK